MGGSTGTGIKRATGEHGFNDNKKSCKENRTGQHKKSRSHCPAAGSVEEGAKEISNWFKMCCKVWGVDLTHFFIFFYFFYIIYIHCIYFICIFERSTRQKHSSQQKTTKMRAIINRTVNYGTLNGVITKNEEIRKVINQSLKQGNAKLIIDTDETLMYILK